MEINIIITIGLICIINQLIKIINIYLISIKINRIIHLIIMERQEENNKKLKNINKT